MAKHLAPVSTKTKSKQPIGTLDRLRYSKGLQWPITGVSAIGLVLTLGIPANATPANAPGPTPNVVIHELPNQTLTVSADSIAPVVERDAFTATPLAELEAIKKAKADEEARIAAEAAKAEAARLAAEIRANPRSAAAVNARAQAASGGPAARGVFTENPPAASYSGSAVVAYAEQFVGVVPYGSGNNPNDSFSCDGLTQYVFGKFGVSLPRTVSAQAARGVRISPADAQAGDLVVWPGSHIGIYDGNGGVIHSPTPGRKVTHAKGLWGSYQFFRVAG
jgi:cell wall-associated NlpC family hydrolase